MSRQIENVTLRNGRRLVVKNKLDKGSGIYFYKSKRKYDGTTTNRGYPKLTKIVNTINNRIRSAEDFYFLFRVPRY